MSASSILSRSEEPKDSESQRRQHSENLDDKQKFSREHRDYLIDRHGSYNLEPVPSFAGADPYNWPYWKKLTNLLLVSFHAMTATFTAACIMPAFAYIAHDLHISIQQASYLTALQIAILGAAPLLWRPLSDRYGRRPIFLLSLLCSLIGNIGCAKSPSYSTLCLCRAIVALFISPAIAIGSAVVTECFFRKSRGRYIGIWTLMVTLGIPVAPLIFGPVAYHIGWRWIFWILAVMNGVQFLLYFFLGPETLYVAHAGGGRGPDFKNKFLSFGRINPKPLRAVDFVHPLTMASRACVLVPAIAYAMNFLMGSILITVELPQLFVERFGLNPQQIGLQFVGQIIGTLIGELLSGTASDYWMRWRTDPARVRPERRLWLSYLGYLLTITGIVVFLVQLQNAHEGDWNVTPVIGAGIAAAGNQIVTTILITYAVDCYREESASVGVFITFVRQIWGFIGPFWFPSMFKSIGEANSAALCSCLVIAVSLAPTILLQWMGPKWRARQGSTDQS
ncbi:MFS general substrate transporter [Trichodelitschia bisporula]|uniref:MFS general substrate transporter n=1 Tax=Trichodelitschia bisporula TaxID=703511 RepID=A0A6G1I5J0_9PEZI|nr:MFS general substrate transporter [Trichodelitschia bisporula]